MTATAFPPIATDPLPGVRYRAARNADGTFTIRDVPIFGTLARGAKGAPAPITREWLDACLSAHRSDESTGYVPPVKLSHGAGEKPLGFFRLTRVGTTQHDGEEMPTLFGDLVVPAEEFAAFAAGRYPFRSVEIGDWNDPRITQLAILDKSAPYFRFPRMAGVEFDEAGVFARGAIASFAATDPGKRGSRKLVVSYRFGAMEGVDVDEEKKSDDAPAAPAEPAAKDDGDAAEMSAKPDAAPEPAPEAGINEAIMECVTNLAALIAKAFGKGEERAQEPAERAAPAQDNGPDASDPNADEPRKEPEQEFAAMKTEPTKPATMDAAAAAEFAALKNEIADLRGRLLAQESATAEAKKATERTSAINAARARLTAARKVVPASFDADAVEMFNAGTLDRFVAAIIGTREEPPATFGAAFGAGTEAQDAPEVAEFAAMGPETLERARALSRDYDVTKQRLPGFHVSRKTYITANLSAPRRE